MVGTTDAAELERVQMGIRESLKAEALAFNAMRARFKPAQFGHPFAPFVGNPECSARYEFWPANSRALPLLSFLAAVILCSPVPSTANESLHSVASFIASKHHSSLSVKNVEFFSLARVLLPGMQKTNSALSAMSQTLAEDEGADVQSLDLFFGDEDDHAGTEPETPADG
jgi:hypothetical protein